MRSPRQSWPSLALDLSGFSPRNAVLLAGEFDLVETQPLDSEHREGTLRSRFPKMSNINEWMEEHQGQMNTLGHLAAINQRTKQIEQQKEQAAALRAQTAVLEKQSRIEQDRARIEQQRLDIERQRLAAEDADREMRRQQAEQVRELRNLIADVTVSLGRFRKRHLA